ncbi:MAG TPA: RlmE family RNA methyltransferase, partial [Polyangiaceae bacterium]|nr:RlmE family RNA methyltransferase [Polyangiaceae bacterium]
MSRKRGRRQNPYKGPDPHTRAAKAKAFAARSVFKLEEIDRRTRILKPGMHVLDLGAAPGSWSAYASQKIGKKGILVAIDLKPLTQSLGPNAHIV